MDVQFGECILDLFCGLGNFMLLLVIKVVIVVGVEGDEVMVQCGCENVQFNNIDNVEFYVVDLIKLFDGQFWGQVGFDKILIDLFCLGVLEIVVKMMVFRFKCIVYVFCNLVILVRDVGELKKQGYSLIQVGVMDMFFYIMYVEFIVVFELE